MGALTHADYQKNPTSHLIIQKPDKQKYNLNQTRIRHQHISVKKVHSTLNYPIEFLNRSTEGFYSIQVKAVAYRAFQFPADFIIFGLST